MRRSVQPDHHALVAGQVQAALDLHDLFGRGKAGRLPRQLNIDGARPEFDYQVWELAYWSPGDDFEMTIEPLD